MNRHGQHHSAIVLLNHQPQQDTNKRELWNEQQKIHENKESNNKDSKQSAPKRKADKRTMTSQHHQAKKQKKECSLPLSSTLSLSSSPSPLCPRPPASVNTNHTTTMTIVPTVNGTPLPIAFLPSLLRPPPPLKYNHPHQQHHHHDIKSIAPLFFQGKPLRSGKWTREEEVYTARLVDEFVYGCILVSNPNTNQQETRQQDEEGITTGTTLRTYLSRKLHCAPMRISKKFPGQNMGKMIYQASPLLLLGGGGGDGERNTTAAIKRRPLSAQQIQSLHQATRTAQATFYQAVAFDVHFYSPTKNTAELLNVFVHQYQSLPPGAPPPPSVPLSMSPTVLANTTTVMILQMMMGLPSQLGIAATATATAAAVSAPQHQQGTMVASITPPPAASSNMAGALPCRFLFPPLPPLLSSASCQDLSQRIPLPETSKASSSTSTSAAASGASTSKPTILLVSKHGCVGLPLSPPESLELASGASASALVHSSSLSLGTSNDKNNTINTNKKQTASPASADQGEEISAVAAAQCSTVTTTTTTMATVVSRLQESSRNLTISRCEEDENDDAVFYSDIDDLPDFLAGFDRVAARLHNQNGKNTKSSTEQVATTGQRQLQQQKDDPFSPLSVKTCSSFDDFRNFLNSLEYPHPSSCTVKQSEQQGGAPPASMDHYCEDETRSKMEDSSCFWYYPPARDKVVFRDSRKEDDKNDKDFDPFEPISVFPYQQPHQRSVPPWGQLLSCSKFGAGGKSLAIATKMAAALKGIGGPAQQTPQDPVTNCDIPSKENDSLHPMVVINNEDRENNQVSCSCSSSRKREFFLAAIQDTCEIPLDNLPLVARAVSETSVLGHSHAGEQEYFK